jgi:pilus assembly protein CpaF
MKGGGPLPPSPEGGEQFPPIDSLPLSEAEAETPALPQSTASEDAMARLTTRSAASGEQGKSKAEGFEASVHLIKEQVSPGSWNGSIPKRRQPSTRTSSPRNSARSSAKSSPS